MAEPVLPTYNCTQLELYEITDLGYNNLAADRADFFAKNTTYTPAKLITLRATRQAAMDLPSEEQRDELHQTLYNKLVNEFMPPILDDFQNLKGYIEKGWPTEDPKPRIQSAGGTLYISASKKNWENVKGMAKAMREFMTVAGNATALTTPGGMTPTFVADCADHELRFNTNYALFMSARETGTGQAEKIAANNLLDKEFKEVLKDGAERVYRLNAAKQKNYFFVTLKELVSPPGSASLKVTLKKPDDTGVANQLVTIKAEGKPALQATTDANYVALFEGIDPDRYNGTIVIGGVTTGFVKDVNKGTDARITVVVP